MQALTCDLWLMERSAFHQFLSVASLTAGSEQAKVAASVPARRQKAVGIIPIHGAIEARASFVGEMFGMPSYERIGQIFDEFVSNEGVSSIILDICSPGGMVYGCMELAQKIFSARGVKPIIAVANPVAASGAYWLGAAADRVIGTPSSDTGSVGVIAERVDMSKALEASGAKVDVIRSTKSPYKAEMNDAEPITDEIRANMQARADGIYERFASDLSRFRGVSVEHVEQKFGQGRMVDAKRAMSAGMIDRVDTLQGVVTKVADGRYRIGERASEDVWDAPTRREVIQRRADTLLAKAETNGETV